MPEQDASDVGERSLDGASSTGEELTEKVGALHDDIDALHAKFDERFREDVSKESLFNQLYEDLQSRRREQLDDHLLPLIRSILLIVDRIEISKNDSPSLVEELDSVRAELLDAVFSVGVEMIEVNPDRRDSRLQQVVEVSPSLPGLWEERRPGYVLGTRVLRAQRIAVRESSPREGSA